MKNKNDQLYCVKCAAFVNQKKESLDSIIVKEESVQDVPKMNVADSPETVDVPIVSNNSFANVKDTLHQKIEHLGTQLKSVTHPADIAQTCAALEAAAKALKSLSELP
jgi:hypothetical protein